MKSRSGLVQDGSSPQALRGSGQRLGCECFMQMTGYCLSQRRRNGIANLASYFDLGTFKNEVVREALEPGRLPVRDGTVRLRVKVAALLRLEELCSDCR